MLCKLCGGNKWNLEGQLFDGDGNLAQQTYSCDNPKCPGTINLDPMGHEI